MTFDGQGRAEAEGTLLSINKRSCTPFRQIQTPPPRQPPTSPPISSLFFPRPIFHPFINPSADSDSKHQRWPTRYVDCPLHHPPIYRPQQKVRVGISCQEAPMLTEIVRSARGKTAASLRKCIRDGISPVFNSKTFLARLCEQAERYDGTS